MKPERKEEIRVTVDSIRYLEPRPEETIRNFDWRGVADDVEELLTALDEAEEVVKAARAVESDCSPTECELHRRLYEALKAYDEGGK